MATGDDSIAQIVLWVGESHILNPARFVQELFFVRQIFPARMPD